MKFKLSNLKLSYAVWFWKLPAVLVVNKYPLEHGRSDISSPLYFQPSSLGIVVKCWRFDGQTTYLPNILRLFSLVRTCLQGGWGEGLGGNVADWSAHRASIKEWSWVAHAIARADDNNTHPLSLLFVNKFKGFSPKITLYNSLEMLKSVLLSYSCTREDC